MRITIIMRMFLGCVDLIMWRHSQLTIRTAVGTLLVALVVLSGCAVETSLRDGDDRVQVIVTTAILQDLVTEVGGDRVVVSSIVPATADPHSYEPTLRSIRNIVYADLAFSNYLMLEQHSIIKALDANLRAGVPNVSLAEGAVEHAAEVIPLVEHVATDAVWLGMRVRGAGVDQGATRSSDVQIRATGFDGPGVATAYLTKSFGEPVFYMKSNDSGDGLASAGENVANLPPDAHTHMSWVFSEPGIYHVDFAGTLQVEAQSSPVDVGAATMTFAVGVDPTSVPDMVVKHVLDGGHGDVTVDLDTHEMYLYADEHGGGDNAQQVFDPATTVIEIPDHAMVDLPPNPEFRFLGKPGDQVYQLPQAVLGQHVHGEIDPHLWHDVTNVKAYVELIAESLSGVDPSGAHEYRAGADKYIDQLGQLDVHVRETIASIPKERRKLVTTHDAFGYLAAAYDIEIAGFVTPHPASEPSLLDRQRLSNTIEEFKIPAVFIEPNLMARSSTLTEVAEDAGVQVCQIYADSFGPEVNSYLELMEFNAASLKRCLT